MTAIENRYEFVLFYDVENGNPNGDPDAGNMPRIDPEDNRGLVTDVCLKRKIRNYIELSKNDEAGFNIYVQEKAVLNKRHEEAYEKCGLTSAKNAKASKDDRDKAMSWMCQNYYDIRAFGAVMTTEVNCGQVRGPVQIAFSKSVDPIMPAEISITRMAVTNEKDIDKERTMGRKFIVPYGLYRAEGFISAPLAEKTGFSDEDLKLLWDALINMFEHDHSAARGKMSARKLFVFKHDSRMGKVPAHKLFDSIKAMKKVDGPARTFSDYDISINSEVLQEMKEKGVTMEEKL